jgi:hypothetical protein
VRPVAVLSGHGHVEDGDDGREDSVQAD